MKYRTVCRVEAKLIVRSFEHEMKTNQVLLHDSAVNFFRLPGVT